MRIADHGHLATQYRAGTLRLRPLLGFLLRRAIIEWLGGEIRSAKL